jgi:hypothetical protein
MSRAMRPTVGSATRCRWREEGQKRLRARGSRRAACREGKTRTTGRPLVEKISWPNRGSDKCARYSRQDKGCCAPEPAPAFAPPMLSIATASAPEPNE